VSDELAVASKQNVILLADGERRQLMQMIRKKAKNVNMMHPTR